MKNIWNIQFLQSFLYFQECAVDRFRQEQCEQHNSDTKKYHAHYLSGIEKILFNITDVNIIKALCMNLTLHRMNFCLESLSGLMLRGYSEKQINQSNDQTTSTTLVN